MLNTHNTETKLIGIHNQDPMTLFVQFSVGERYYIYERDCVTKSESVKEENFGVNKYYRQDLNSVDEKILLGMIMFYPKIKRAISDYPF